MTSPPNGKRRPVKAANPKSIAAGNDPRIQPIGDTPAATGRRYWARQLIERQTADRPMYGSTAWLMLPNDHPDKIAACVVAAECWAMRADELESDARRELERSREAFKRAEDAEYTQAYAAHRKRMTGKYGRVLTSFEERRARQLEATRAQESDFDGGLPRPSGAPAPAPLGDWDSRFWNGGDSA